MPLRPDGPARHPEALRGTYRCISFQEGPAAPTGPHVAVKAELIDQYVADVIVETMGLPDAVDLFSDETGEVDIAALRERLILLERALAKLSLQNSLDQIPDHVFAANAAEISAERKAITAQIAEVGQVNAAAVLVASADVQACWDGMNISERRAVLRSVARITLRPPGCGCRKPDLDQLVRIAWKTPHRA
jgi:hypothetical protein